MIKVEVLEMPGCACCAAVKKILEKLKDEFNLKIKVWDLSKHPELAQKYQLLTSPGIVINGKLALTGEVNETEVRARLREVRKR